MDVAPSLAHRHSRGEIRLDDDWIARTGEMACSAIANQPQPRKE